MPIKPARLNFGDVVGVVAPASAPADPKSIDRALRALGKLGFEPKPAAHLRSRWGFLAGQDRHRADDLMEMFLDESVKAIVCFRGGYGAARLLPLLDYPAIRRNPKIFIGYSDITSLHCALLAKANLVSFHGPMLNSDLLKDNLPEFTRQSFLQTLMRAEPPGGISRKYRRKTIQVLSPGTATGPLVGGNISILCASLATPYQPSFRGAILFFEDLNEEPYRFDRMLTQLLNAGLLQQVAGIAVGINKRCADPKARKGREYRQSLEDVLRERLAPLGVPVVTGLPFGHVPYNATLPVGTRALLDGKNGELSILESAVL
jgi:muramoyltetrapeptide carboxypeptidase